ncbi:MAG: phosphoribosylformylglycinamidine synthase I [Candidatus Peribacteraceae bacterium]|jgi:phosphoribosylformylglycinamidine synthase|nr:phosphoribosylformylglycinamidine synthase I [Candidatus Peribacteraceae bacterium]MDP7454751.1 phosphoribosylformylglycinamidine synthase I [Candidatus Peribacteraceae bacterium]
MKIAVVSFPGNNCEVESIRAIKNAGMEPVYFKWNDSKEKLSDVSGYFIPGGFSYEDRGRAGMVSARDPVMQFIAKEADKGKVVIGVCNGAQVLVESGLIPLDRGLKMSLAWNVVDGEAVGFLNKWVWITPTCSRDRCATSDWEGVLQLPIAHGEGRFTTKDKDVIEELKKNDQVAFSYCDKDGNVSDEAPICPNGAMFSAAGICNQAGNVIALMPHPERSSEGGVYFESMRRWIEKGTKEIKEKKEIKETSAVEVNDCAFKNLEIFIDTIIVNNEERTVEQAARRVIPNLTLKQLKYLALGDKDPQEVLSHLSLFNPNKEIAYIKRGDEMLKWNADSKKEEETHSPLEGAVVLIRRDDPDTGAGYLGKGGESGICYVLGQIKEQDISSANLLEVFSNRHSSSLERMK